MLFVGVRCCLSLFAVARLLVNYVLLCVTVVLFVGCVLLFVVLLSAARCCLLVVVC